MTSDRDYPCLRHRTPPPTDPCITELRFCSPDHKQTITIHRYNDLHIKIGDIR